MEPGIATPMALRLACRCVVRRSPFAICCKQILNFRFNVIVLQYQDTIHQAFIQYIRQRIAIRLRLILDEFPPPTPDSFLRDVLQVLQLMLKDMAKLQSALVDAVCAHKSQDRYPADCQRVQMEHLELYAQLQHVQWDIKEELEQRYRRRRDTEWKKEMLKKYDQTVKKDVEREFAEEMAKLGVIVGQ